MTEDGQIKTNNIMLFTELAADSCNNELCFISHSILVFTVTESAESKHWLVKSKYMVCRISVITALHLREVENDPATSGFSSAPMQIQTCTINAAKALLHHSCSHPGSVSSQAGFKHFQSKAAKRTVPEALK